MKKETVFGVLTWAVIIGLLVLGFKSCNWISDRQAARTDEAKKKNQQKIEDEFNQWCAANNATPAFKGLPGSDLLTIDLQRSLFVKEKRVAFKAQLFDVWRSEKRGTMMACFTVGYSDVEIYVYLKCTESQAQELRDNYLRDKDATLLIAAEFEYVGLNVESNSNPDSESDYKKKHSAIGTLITYAVAKLVRPTSASAVQDND